ncbi:MAG: hypothetical protein MPK62_15030 [Alphaproteobacteria bacterium]|nr:hypothetical protein [Alphaproteobacteria bacterium]
MSGLFRGVVGSRVSRGRGGARGRGGSRGRGGVTLLEVMGVLVVGLLVVVTAVALVDRFNHERRVQQAVNGVQFIAHQMQRLHFRAPVHSGGRRTVVDLTSRVVTAGFLPPGFSAETTRRGYQVRHPLTTSGSGSSLFVEGVLVTGDAGRLQMMQIRFESLSSDACLSVGSLAFPGDARLVRTVVSAGGDRATILTPLGVEALSASALNDSSYPLVAGVAPGDISAVCELGNATVTWQFLGNIAPI